MAMYRFKIFIFIITIGAGFTSCARYSCKAPDGTVCKSVKQIYTDETEKQGQPQTQVTAIVKKDREPPPAVYEDKAPLWIPPKKLRLWISRWVDNKGNYHQPGYMYIEVEKGRWSSEEGKVDEMIMEGEQDGNTDKKSKDDGRALSAQ